MIIAHMHFIGNLKVETAGEMGNIGACRLFLLRVDFEERGNGCLWD